MNLPHRRTLDDSSSLSPVSDAVRAGFLITSELGPTRLKTPQGYLLCKDVPIARTGNMDYPFFMIGKEAWVKAEMEPPPFNSVITAYREAEDVFAEEALASYHGMPVVNDHPQEDVIPTNWNRLACGVVLDPRRGEGDQSDLMIADLLITNPEAIAEVESGRKVEVSCGYKAMYIATGPRMVRQFNFKGNHVALVYEGRCGHVCAIGDSQPQPVSTGDCAMAAKEVKVVNKSVVDSVASRVRAALARLSGADATVRDEATTALQELETAPVTQGTAADMGGHEIHIHHSAANTQDDDDPRWAENEKQHKEFRDSLEALNKRCDTMSAASTVGDNEEIEGDLEEEAPVGTGDSAKIAKDSQFLEQSFRATIAAAEIVHPGVRVPTWVRADAPKKTLDAMCKVRRDALELAYATADGRSVIDSILGGRTFTPDKMSCRDLRVALNAASGAMRVVNNAANRGAAGRTNDAGTSTDTDAGRKVSLKGGGLQKYYDDFAKKNHI